MIMNADVLKKKRAEAKEKQRMVARSGGAPVNKEQNLTTPIRSKGAAPKVVSKLKMEGLTALLGKISMRATKNGVKIVSQGRTPDSVGTGRAGPSAAVGSLQGVSTQAGNGGSTFKVGGVGTFGKGGGTSVKGQGGLALGGAGSASVGVLDEETEIEGGLDKDVIARVINSHLGEIRYCYERQLSAEPDIYGKVAVKFTIGAQGLVETQRVGMTTLRSAMVEGCILRRVASWKFPLPKGGTQVLVTYPFLFKSTN
jgi:outer membrane biosynthesis protein TonB